LADDEGKVIGGHLIDGVVFTTCEVVLGAAEGVEFFREMDGRTGYRELVPMQISQSVDLRLMKLCQRFATVLFIAGVGFVVGRMKR
jgi:hypothetical protein